MRLHLAIIIVFSVCFFNFSNLSWSAEVRAVKGKKILINLQEDNFKVGDVLRIENPDGKYVGLAKITRVKGTVAEAITKGKAEKGYKLKLRPPKAKVAKSSSSQSGESKTRYGFAVGYNTAKADIDLPSGTKVALSGSGFSVKGLMDFDLLAWLKIRGLAGLEQFNVGGKNDLTAQPQGCGGECTAEINYLSADVWGRVPFGSGNFQPWVGIGFDILFPLSKKSTALDEDSITNTSIIAIGGGFDWKLKSGKYFPIQIEYNLYPSTDEVSANTLALRVGYVF